MSIRCIFFALFGIMFVPAVNLAQTPTQLLMEQELATEALSQVSPSNGDLYQVIDSYDTTSFAAHIVIRRYASDLSLQQSQELNFPSGKAFRLDAMQVLSTGGLTVAGITRPILTENDSVFISRITPATGLLWSNSFQLSSKRHQVTGMLETSDGGVIVYGLADDPAGFGNLIFLYKFSINGTEVWSRQVSSQISGAFHYAGDMVEAANGDLWLLGSTRLTTEGSWLARFSSSGQTQTTTMLRTHPLLTAQPEPTDLVPRPGGGWDLWYAGNNSQNGEVGLLLRLGANLSPELVRRYSLPQGLRGRLRAVAVAPDGSFIWSGDMADGSGARQGFLVNIQPDVTQRRARQYGDERYYQLNQVVALDNDSYLLTGLADPKALVADPDNDGAFPWLARTDAQAQLDCFSTSLTLVEQDTTVISEAFILDNNSSPEPNQTDISINTVSLPVSNYTCSATPVAVFQTDLLRLYPNPGQEQVWLDWGNGTHDKATIRVFDPLGRAVLSLAEQRSQLSALRIAGPPGIYLIWVSVADQQQVLRWQKRSGE